MSKINHKEMLDVGVKIFRRMGVSKINSELVMKSLVESSLRGTDSHGVNLIPRYMDSIKNGKINPLEEPSIDIDLNNTNQFSDTLLDKNSFIRISGNDGFGQVTATFGIKEGIKKAKKNGVSIVALTDTNHIGTLGQYNSMASKEGLICFSVCNGGANVAPYGGKERYLGTNPISFTVPTRPNDKNPIIVDFATSVFPESKIREYRDKGMELPANIVLDSGGKPSTNPNDFYNGGSLLPIGNHKGYGLSLMVEILGGLFTGSGFHGFGSTPTYKNGVMFIMFDALVFQGLNFWNDISEFKKKIKEQPTADGVDEIFLPGEIELKIKEERLKNGIPISRTLSEIINVFNDEPEVVVMGVNMHINTSTLNSNSIVLDFGANKGEYIKYILDEYNCKVIAYEPTSWLFNDLYMTYGYSKNVELNKLAIWSENIIKKFYDYGPHVSSGRANSLGYIPDLIINADDLQKEEKVICKSFDSVLDKFNKVDICKMDIEGAEVEVLSKASDESLLKCNQICGEFHIHDSQRMEKGIKSITKEDIYNVIDRLDKLGFKHVITEYELHAETGKPTDGPKYIIFYQEEKINE